MSLQEKPLWLEGMLVQPQHFQQYDRWIEHVVDGRVAGLNGFGWGVRELSINRELLAIGQFQLAALKAVMPDGTVIDVPDVHAAPAARSVPPTTSGALVKVALPARAQDGREIASDGVSWHRFDASEQKVRDTTADGRPVREVRVARLALRLITEGEREDDTVSLPIARIREVEPTGAILLSSTYIPPILDHHVAEALVGVLNEVRGLLKSRGDALASRADPSRAGLDSAGLIDLLTLLLVNGQEALFDHFGQTRGLHPEVIYRALVHLVGATATFTPSRRKPATLPAYRHDDLETCLAPIMDILRQALAVVIERNAVPIPLQARGYGITTATVADRTLFQDARFVLIAIASVPSETLRAQFPTQVKIGSVEQIRDLVNLQLPGIGLRALPVAPREMPYMQNAVYFELDQASELWRALPRSAAFAFHISGEYTDLHLEFWAIRGKTS